jgi:ribosomal protein S18 acetylase RimI-like enzyme
MSNLILTISNRIKGNVDEFVNTIYNNFADLTDNPTLMHNKNEIRNLLLSPHFIGLFLFDNNKLIGYLVGEEKFLNDGRHVYYISYIYVTVKMRTKKLGSLLMKNIEQIIKQKKIKYIVLTYNTSNKKLTNFYNILGYNIDLILETNSIHNVFSKNLF